jgi:hypothetical protein
MSRLQRYDSYPEQRATSVLLVVFLWELRNGFS